MPILSEFVHGAMEEARYKLFEDGGYFGEIVSCPGVWAHEQTLEACRKVLLEVLEEWLLLKLRDRDPLPLVKGIDLNRLVADGS